VYFVGLYQKRVVVGDIPGHTKGGKPDEWDSSDLHAKATLILRSSLGAQQASRNVELFRFMFVAEDSKST
jgi:hypothetical protein